MTTSPRRGEKAPSWADQCSILEDLQDAERYTQRRGVVFVASAGNSADDLAHPTHDATSPDGPPNSARRPRGAQQLPRCAGGAFCAGGDVKGMADGPPGGGARGVDAAIQRQRRWHRATAVRLWNCPSLSSLRSPAPRPVRGSRWPWPAIAYRYMKENTRRAAAGAGLYDCLDAEATHHVQTALSGDHRNAVQAFVEKRTPTFRRRQRDERAPSRAQRVDGSRRRRVGVAELAQALATAVGRHGNRGEREAAADGAR